MHCTRRILLRCSDCEFSTRVRKNLEKHLKLHLRRKKMERMTEPKQSSGSSDDEEEKLRVPVITPINAPTVLDPHSDKATKMSNLLDCDSEEYTRPMSDEDMAAMPGFVPERIR